MLGHLCLINDNSEMNDDQNNIQIIFLILLFQALIFLFQVNSFILELLSNNQMPLQQKTPAQIQQWKHFGAFIVKFEHKVFLLLTLNK